MSIYKKLFNVKKAGVKIQRDTKAYNYKYATLDQIQNKLWDVFEKEWLVIVHYIENWILTTEIVDIETDEKVKSSIELTTTKPQDKGSEITYFRRYNLLSLLDLEVEDDDGKKAQDSKIEKPWFNKAQLDWLKKVKWKFKDWEEALQKAKEKYKISKEMEKEILNLYK